MLRPFIEFLSSEERGNDIELIDFILAYKGGNSIREYTCKHPFAPKKMPFRDKINKYDAIYC